VKLVTQYIPLKNLVFLGAILLLTGSLSCRKHHGHMGRMRPPVEAFRETVPSGGGATGYRVYRTACIACHQTGVGGAPALRDTQRWRKIIQQGMDTLVQHAWEGYTGQFGSMPPRGACNACSKEELRQAILYMLSAAGVTFPEPSQ
jgi:cytochrome c5